MGDDGKGDFERQRRQRQRFSSHRFLSEFLPDLARRIHIRVVIVQQIINQVAKTEPMGEP